MSSNIHLELYSKVIHWKINKTYRVILIECDLGKFPKGAIGPTFKYQLFYMDNRCSSDAQVLVACVNSQFYPFYPILSEYSKGEILIPFQRTFNF